MEIAVGKIKFSLLALLVYLSLTVLLISLGFWQMGRADEKRIFLQKQAQSAEQDIVKLELLIELDLEKIRYRKVNVTGHFDQDHQFLIDNQIVNGRAGYFVMTPFKIDNSNTAVLVNRGWVELNKDRRILPDLPITNLKTSISARINHFPVVGIRLDGAEIPTE